MKDFFKRVLFSNVSEHASSTTVSANSTKFLTSDILKRKNNVQKANDCLFLTQYAVVRFFHSSILTASAVSCHFFIIPPL